MKKNYITYLNVLSCFAVVCLHTNGSFWHFTESKNWIFSNLIECIFYFAVPVFFMISGATLLEYRKKYNTKEFFKKRFSKTLIPFISWSIIGIVYMCIIDKHYLNHCSLINIFEMILNTRIIDIYWFFIPLFSVYLCLPILSLIDFNKNRDTLKYLIVITFVLNIFLPNIFSVCHMQYNVLLSSVVCMDYMVYVLTGYYLDNNEISKKIE